MDACAAEELWCVHVIGPDDLHAAPSRQEAERVAWEWTRYYVQHPRHRSANWPRMSFLATRWPWSAESHAEDVKLWEQKTRRRPA